jgi:hypothetical protein
MTWKKYRTIQAPAFSGKLSAIHYERYRDEYGEIRPRRSPCRLLTLKTTSAHRSDGQCAVWFWRTGVVKRQTPQADALPLTRKVSHPNLNGEGVNKLASQKGITDARTCQTGQIERILSDEIGRMPMSEPAVEQMAYTSVSGKPLIGYWMFLAVAIGLVCVTTGWHHIHDPKARFRWFGRKHSIGLLSWLR